MEILTFLNYQREIMKHVFYLNSKALKLIKNVVFDTKILRNILSFVKILTFDQLNIIFCMKMSKVRVFSVKSKKRNLKIINFLSEFHLKILNLKVF